MKQREVAEALGITPEYVSMIERGSKTPSLDLLRKWVELYRVNLSVVIVQAERME